MLGNPPCTQCCCQRAVTPDPPELGSLSPTRLGWGLLWGMGWMENGGDRKKGAHSCSAMGMWLRCSQVSCELDAGLGSKSRVQSEGCLHQCPQ